VLSAIYPTPKSISCGPYEAAADDFNSHPIIKYDDEVVQFPCGLLTLRLVNVAPDWLGVVPDVELNAVPMLDDDVDSFAAWDTERTVRFPLVTVRVTEPDVAEPVAVALCTIPSFVVASIPEPSRIVISQPV
jgi:hypothetical protein